MTGGRAFLEHLQDPEPYPGRVCSYFTLHVNFMGQRYHSKDIACACEPAFDEGTYLFITYLFIVQVWQSICFFLQLNV